MSYNRQNLIISETTIIVAKMPQVLRNPVKPPMNDPWKHIANPRLHAPHFEFGIAALMAHAVW